MSPPDHDEQARRRQETLARKLRENLARRKAQQRARRAGSGDSSESEVSGDAADGQNPSPSGS